LIGIIAEKFEEVFMKKVLLHACCGPCAEYPLQELMKQDLEITVYYFNPNIHPVEEWTRRLEQLKKLTDKYGLKLIVDGGSDPETWLDWERNGKLDRCRMCYETRLGQAAAIAAREGMDSFLSTLQVSPYQDFELITKIGQELANKYNIEYMPVDFRPGYRTGQNMAREDGLYRQKYCGCNISLENSKFRDKILRDLEGLKAQQ
jgi:predicted adenine nucleotide alpha hydrolase (AANH) superfamily ATPase